jgi:acid phosphatase (class A)
MSWKLWLPGFLSGRRHCSMNTGTADMTLSRRLLLTTALAVSLAMPAFAAEPYITGKMMDLTVLVPPPPAKGSDADKADMQAVIDAQANASDARKAQALVDSNESAFDMFTSVLGDKFVAANTPKAATMFERIGDSENDTLDAAKPFFGRIRPYLANPDVVKAYTKLSKSGSYPSGHVTRVTIMAIMVAAMVPEKKAEVWARAADYAESRVVGGMHYPTDVLAGWRTGTAMAAVMFQMPGFKADFDAAKTEVRAALGM